MCNAYAHRKDLNISLLTFIKKSSQEILYFDIFILVGRTDSMNKLKQVFLQLYMCFPEDLNQTLEISERCGYLHEVVQVISCSMLLFQVVHGLLLLGMVQDKAYPDEKKRIHLNMFIFKRKVQK